MYQKSSLKKPRAVSIVETKDDDQLLVIKEGGMSEITSGIDAVSELKSKEDYTTASKLGTEEKYPMDGRESYRKSVKIDRQSPIVISSSELMMKKADEVQIDDEEEFVSVLFGFQSTTEMEHVNESVSAFQPSSATSFQLHNDSLLHINLESIQNFGLKSTPSDSKTDCPFFKHVVAFSEGFVDNIIQDAEIRVNSSESLNPTLMSEQHSRYDSQDSRHNFHIKERTFKGWPTIGEFHFSLGAEKIDEYLSSFKTEEDWFYAVYYDGSTFDGWSSIFHYEVKWSLPTPRYPIVQATATMYFDFEASLTLPKHCKVKVSYWYEGNNLRFDPEVTEFNEFTLNHILDKKLKWFQSVTY